MTSCLMLYRGETQAACHTPTHKQLLPLSCEGGLAKLAHWIAGSKKV